MCDSPGKKRLHASHVVSVLVEVTIAMLKLLRKRNVGRKKGLFGLYLLNTSPPSEAKAELKLSRNLQAGAGAEVVKCYLPACSSWLTQLVLL